MVKNLSLKTRYITGDLGNIDYTLADTIVDLIIGAWEKGVIPVIHSAPNTGKTTASNYISRKIEEKTGRTGLLALPTRTINANKRTELTYTSSYQAQTILDQKDLGNIPREILDNSTIAGVYDSTANAIHTLEDTGSCFVAIDEVAQLYQAISYRDKVIGKLLDLPYIYGMSGTPKMMEYSERFLVIKLIQDAEIKASPSKLYLMQHNTYKLRTLVSGIIDFNESDLLEGDLLCMRINSYFGIREMARWITKNTDFTVACLFSHDETVERENPEKATRHFFGINSHLGEEITHRLRSLDIDETIDILLTTQVSDEGIDFNLNVKDGRKRKLIYHIVNAKTPVVNEEGKVTGAFTGFIEPEVVAQIVNRERSGNQVTYLHGFMRDDELPDYSGLLSEIESSNPTTVEYYNEVSKLFSLRTNLKEEIWIEEVSQYNIEVETSSSVVHNIIYDTRLSHGQVREYICLHDLYDFNLENGITYEGVMQDFHRTGWIQDCATNVTLSEEVADKVRDVIVYEIRAAELNIPFEWFISETGYYFDRLKKLVETFEYKRDNSNEITDLLNQLLKLEDTKINIECFRNNGSTYVSYVKSLARLLYDSPNWNWTRKTKTLKYSFEPTYPDYYKPYQSVSKTQRQQREQWELDHTYSVIEHTNQLTLLQ